jgi:hypothetical protein
MIVGGVGQTPLPTFIWFTLVDNTAAVTRHSNPIETEKLIKNFQNFCENIFPKKRDILCFTLQTLHNEQKATEMFPLSFGL